MSYPAFVLLANLFVALITSWGVVKNKAKESG